MTELTGVGVALAHNFLQAAVQKNRLSSVSSTRFTLTVYVAVEYYYGPHAYS